MGFFYFIHFPFSLFVEYVPPPVSMQPKVSNHFLVSYGVMGCGAAEATGLGFVCFGVINPRVLSANRVDLAFVVRFHTIFFFTELFDSLFSPWAFLLSFVFQSKTVFYIQPSCCQPTEFILSFFLPTTFMAICFIEISFVLPPPPGTPQRRILLQYSRHRRFQLPQTPPNTHRSCTGTPRTLYFKYQII